MSGIIEAASVRVSTLADGTLRLTVDIEPRHAQAAFSLFGAPGVAMALAALKSNAGRPESDAGRADDIGQRSTPPTLPAPIGPICKWLVMRCKEQDFRQWLGEKGAFYSTPDAEVAAGYVRALCGVTSRKEIDGNDSAEAIFQEHIRGPWAKYQLARGATNKPTKEHA